MTKKLFFAFVAYGVSGVFLVAAAKMANMTPDQMGVAITFAMLIHLNGYFLGEALIDKEQKKRWEKYEV